MLEVELEQIGLGLGIGAEEIHGDGSRRCAQSSSAAVANFTI